MPGWVAEVAGAGNLGFRAQDLLENQNEAVSNLLCAPSFLPGPREAAAYTERRDFVITNVEGLRTLRDRMPCPAGRQAPGLRARDRGRAQRPVNRVTLTRAGHDLT